MAQKYERAALNIHTSTEKVLTQIIESVIEKCHLKFCSFIFGIGKKAPNIILYGETIRISLYAEAFIHMIKYRHKLHNKKDKQLTILFKKIWP